MEKKTIRMPKEDLAASVAALRDPNNKQGKRKLYDHRTGGFCCLGLMQFTKTGGKIEALDDDGDTHLVSLKEINHGQFASCGLPTREWLNSVGWEFSTGFGNLSDQPYLPTFDMEAAHANDAYNKTFAEIADAIEACAEGY